MKSMMGIAFPLIASVLIVMAVACQSAPAGPGEPAAAAQPTAVPAPATPPAAVPTPPQPAEPNMVEVPAPIHEVEVITAESFPPQYFLTVTSGRPNGCVEFDSYDVTRDGDTIKVTVTNREPEKGSPVACTMLYGIVETNIPLGSDFEPGKTYTIVVNDKTQTFTTQSAGATEPDTDRPDTVEVLAPIEGVQIEVTGSGPSAEAEMIVVSGLPDTCHELGGHRNLRREGDTIKVQVMNSRQADPTVGCAEVYRIVETRIPLGGDIEPCKTYQVDVNGAVQRVQAIGPAIRCRSPESPTGGGEPGELDMVEVPAPIESVDIQIAESFPPQYFLIVTSGLPNGCVKFGDYGVQRDGDIIRVKITNLAPADKSMMCAMVYGMVDTRIPLGSDFEPGRTYTVEVNDKTETFTAQGTGGSPAPPSVNEPVDLDSKFRLKVGQTVSIRSEALDVSFVEVVEDSRCPESVVCIWEGQAKILVAVTNTRNGEDLGRHELTIGGAGRKPASASFGRYSVEVLALDPYPATPDQGEKQDYTATLVVTRAGAGRTSDNSQQSLDVFDVSLRAGPVQGQPLTMRFVAEITGGHDNSQGLYCQGTSWEFGDGMGVAAMPGCLVWTPEAEINRHFKQTYTYEAPGTYRVTFTYGPLPSETIAVEVR